MLLCNLHVYITTCIVAGAHRVRIKRIKRINNSSIPYLPKAINADSPCVRDAITQEAIHAVINIENILHTSKIMWMGAYVNQAIDHKIFSDAG